MGKFRLTFHNLSVPKPKNYHSGWKAMTADFVRRIVQAYEHAENHNIDLPYDQIISIVFVPDLNGYICIEKASDGTTTCL